MDGPAVVSRNTAHKTKILHGCHMAGLSGHRNKTEQPQVK